jgi:hypothetical protein
MARWQGTTTQRGLGAPHVRDKKRLKAQLQDGEPCWRCGQPMYQWQELDRDHVIDRALGGMEGPAVLAHASCNRSAGAKLGNQMYPQRQRMGRAPGYDTICKTCGKAYNRAARICAVCGTHYHPSGPIVRTCGRACGVLLRKQLYGHAGGSQRKPRPACETCGKPCSGLGMRFCSLACAGKSRTAARQTWSAVAIETYTCRYCGKLGARKANMRQLREVCEARICQLARLQANNLVARNGVTKQDADAHMACLVMAAVATHSDGQQ